MTEQGVKETREALIALIAITGLVVPHLKDGFQAGKDLPAIFADLSASPEIQAKIKAGIADIHLSPAELKGITIPEVIQLISVLYPRILVLIEKISKA